MYAKWQYIWMIVFFQKMLLLFLFAEDSINTVNQEMLVAIIFGDFENITIWQKFNLEILLEESGWVHIFSFGDY